MPTGIWGRGHCGGHGGNPCAGDQRVEAGPTEFKADVNAAIDAGLAFSRANNYFTTDTSGNGLSLLTLLEKESIPAGYNGLDAGDKVLAQNAACILIDSFSYGDRGSFYAYTDGQTLMGLAVYLETGGPDTPTGPAGYNCTGRSARQTIDKVSDRSRAAQSTGVVGPASCAGYWNYTGPGCDSSTTQFALAGLSAAKGFYSVMGESLDMPRIPLITASLDKISAAYAANGKLTTTASGGSGGSNQFNTCGAGCTGHGYQQNYGPGNTSSQQTASGTWGQLTGTGKTVNDTNLQGYLRWLQNTYSYTTNARYDGWPNAYFYYLWSSSKAYNIIQNSGVPADPGNIDPAGTGLSGIGTLPAIGTREVNRDPAVDTRPAPRGAGGAGYYAGTPKGWYYDYAYRLMSLQQASGYFPNPNGPWNNSVDHAYAILVLQRSEGGACADSDSDGVCDNVDNCPSVANPGQENAYGDARGDACEPPLNPTIKLNVATAPGTGTAGVTNVGVTGAMWPAGSYVASDVQIFVAPACFGPNPAMATGSTLTTILGATRRVTFKIPQNAALGDDFVWVSGPGFTSVNCSKLTVVGAP